MTETNPARLDPEREGLPGIADDTSTAYDDGAHPSFDDGTPIPRDRWVPVDDNASLDVRLRQEEPDISPDDPMTPAVPGLLDEASNTEELDQATIDSDVLESDPIRTNLSRSVGRLADNDGVFADDTDEHGGLSAEEAAMHEVPEDDEI